MSYGTEEPTQHRYPISAPPMETPSAQFAGYRQPPKRKRSHTVQLVAVGAVVAVTLGIVGAFAYAKTRDSEPLAPAAQASTTAAAAGPTKAAATSAPAAKPKAGQEVALPSGLKVTVFAWQSPVAKKTIKPSELDWPNGYVWGALDVQVCLPADAPDGSSLSSAPWTVRFADNTTAEYADVTGLTGWPKPQYPMADRAVPAGSCTRGWITFAVPGGATPSAALYAPPDITPIEWSMK